MWVEQYGYTDEGNIKYCFNNAEVTSVGAATAGGIVGHQESGNIYNSYNLKTIKGNENVGGISGAAGGRGYNIAYIYNCYNIGTVIGNANSAKAIVGFTNANGGTSIEQNCYTSNVTSVLLNNGEFSDNCWINDEKDSNGLWKYNNGYPILNWQVNKKQEILKKYDEMF